MEVVNPFILKNKERMIVFLDQLSSISDPFMLPIGIDICNNSNGNNNSDPGNNFDLFIRFTQLLSSNLLLFHVIRTGIGHFATHLRVSSSRTTEHVEN